MDVALIESKYADLKHAFETGQLSADAYQLAVEDLKTQDEYGRYWLIGAETGEWYYFDGVEWLRADPRQADSLPVVDENGVYWMLGKETNEWYYFDGQSWVRSQAADQPAAESAPDATQYYEDEQGRYWAKGAQSGQWYYYDQTGWHRGDELSQPAAPSAPPYRAEPYPQPQPYQPQTVPFQPVYPAPSYLQTEAPAQPASAPYYPPAQPPQPQYTQPVQPPLPAASAPYYPPAQPVQPPYTQPVAPQPAQPAPAPEAYTQPVTPQPQPVPVETPPTTPPAKAHMEPGVWYYSDGEQWLRYQENQAEATPAETPAQPEETPPADEPLEAGMWYFFDGEQWLGYQQPPAGFAEQSTPPVNAPAGTRAAEEYVKIPEDEILIEPDDEIELDGIDDLEDFVEVVEVNEDDIILDENLVEADFQVEVFKPGEETIPAAKPVAPVAAMPAQPAPEPVAPVEPAQPVTAAPQLVTSTTPILRTTPTAESARPVPMEIATPEKTGAMPKVSAAKPARSAPRPAGSGSLLKALPMWLWTSLGGLATLIVVAGLIIGTIYLLNNKETGAAQIANLQTPTLPAAVAEAITPTPALTPTPTATQLPSPTTVPLTDYASNYFGFALAYPSGWVLKEEDDLVIFAPSARTLNREVINGASVWVLKNNSTDLPQLLADNLERFSPISETLNEGKMNIGEQSWASAQISYQSADMGAEAIALIASTAFDNAGYTLIAVAPSSEWEGYKPLFQYMLNSFKFTRQTVAQAPTDTAPEATEVVAPTEAVENTPVPTGTPTATRPATATPTPTQSGPVTYIVKAGDTLGGIAYQFDVDLDDLIKANNLSGKDVILQIGQELLIPQAGQMIVGAITATPRATGTAAATATSRAGQTPTPTGGKTSTPTAEATPAGTPTATKAPTSAPVANGNLSGRIVYPAYSTDIMSYNVWSTKVDGSDSQIIAGNASQPKYNRNGTLLAYRSWNPSQRGLYFVDTTSGRQGFLTSFIEDALPAWYSDGSAVFPSRREGDRVSRLFKVEQTGQDVGLGFNSDYVDVMPNNQLIARGCTVAGDCGMWLLQPDGSGETKIGNFSSDTAPAVRPQGGSFAFMSFDRDGAGNWEIWTANVDGSNPVRLTKDNASDGLPTWSPDGQSIAFVSDRGGVWGMWAMNADGSNQRKLFDLPGSISGQILHDVPNSKGWLEERITWIP